MGTCETCKYWETEKPNRFDSTRFSCLMMNYAGVIAVSQIGPASSDTEIYTPATFGCNQYEAK